MGKRKAEIESRFTHVNVFVVAELEQANDVGT
jgi:hypothetical protein